MCQSTENSDSRTRCSFWDAGGQLLVTCSAERRGSFPSFHIAFLLFTWKRDLGEPAQTPGLCRGHGWHLPARRNLLGRAWLCRAGDAPPAALQLLALARERAGGTLLGAVEVPLCRCSWPAAGDRACLGHRYRGGPGSGCGAQPWHTSCQERGPREASLPSTERLG